MARSGHRAGGTGAGLNHWPRPAGLQHGARVAIGCGSTVRIARGPSASPRYLFRCRRRCGCQPVHGVAGAGWIDGNYRTDAGAGRGGGGPARLCRRCARGHTAAGDDGYGGGGGDLSTGRSGERYKPVLFQPVGRGQRGCSGGGAGNAGIVSGRRGIAVRSLCRARAGRWRHRDRHHHERRRLGLLSRTWETVRRMENMPFGDRPSTSWNGCVPTMSRADGWRRAR